MNGATAAKAVALACREAFDPGTAASTAAALLTHLEFPVEDMASTAYAIEDGVQIRQAAWLAEFTAALAQELEQC